MWVPRFLYYPILKRRTNSKSNKSTEVMLKSDNEVIRVDSFHDVELKSSSEQLNKRESESTECCICIMEIDCCTETSQCSQSTTPHFFHTTCAKRWSLACSIRYEEGLYYQHSICKEVQCPICKARMERNYINQLIRWIVETHVSENYIQMDLYWSQYPRQCWNSSIKDVNIQLTSLLREYNFGREVVMKSYPHCMSISGTFDVSENFERSATNFYNKAMRMIVRAADLMHAPSDCLHRILRFDPNDLMVLGDELQESIRKRRHPPSTHGLTTNWTELDVGRFTNKGIVCTPVIVTDIH